MTLECQKKVWGKHSVKWSIHLLVRSKVHLASAESLVFDVENRKVLFVSIWVKKSDDGSMISLVGSESRCDHWGATSCPALGICKYEIHMSGKMWAVRNYTTGKKRRKHSIWVPVTLWVKLCYKMRLLTYLRRGLKRKAEDTASVDKEFSVNHLTPKLQQPTSHNGPALYSCLRSKYFILDTAISSVINIFPPLLKMFTRLMPLACI